MNRLYQYLTCDQEKASVLRRIIGENLMLYHRDYILAISSLIVIAGTTAFSAWLMGSVVEDVLLGKNLHQAYFLALIVIIIFTIKGVMTYVQSVTLNKIGNKIVARFQRRIYSHLLSLSIGYFSSRHSAFLVGKINQNIALVRDMINALVLAAARDLLTLLGLITVMLISDPIMSAIIFLAGPLSLFTLRKYARRINTIAEQEVDLHARVTAGIQETAIGIQIVKAFTMERQLYASLFKLTHQLEQRANTIARITARTSPLMETLAGFSIAGIIAYGGWRMVTQSYSTANLSALMTACLMAYEPAKRLARLKVTLEQSLVNARMIYEFLDTPPALTELKGQEPLILDSGDIVFENVSFTYNFDSETRENGLIKENLHHQCHLILKNISFRADGGKITALVGPSGGGKSTALALLQRFYDQQSGIITIDGQNIHNIDTQSLRSQIAYVSQKPVLFQGTVDQNLRFACPNATQSEIKEAACKAQAHHFILSLPNGYDTVLSENGNNLSCGQRQRLSIARAILRNSPILLLDEATSSLDNESESLVQEALEQLIKGRTTLVIAHRFSTISNADSIVVFDNGEVVDQGTHDQLMKSEGGIYARLYRLSISRKN
ncbi:ABC transporter ATP-binding protein [Candidatus Endowatersipora endosymbiont of Watersipora subatra]|uniref:ABC transporter ATP-binding protein n=1 Tax=Candidatus Endowatersipora endosymbiont of Watersipora subatra TaxID=3077946 RepID=UPI00312C98AC